MSISGLGGSPFAGMRGTVQPPSFDSLDTNKDGTVSLDELEAAAPGGASAAGSAQIQQLFKAIDTDGNGSISSDEKSAFDQKVQSHHHGGHHGGGGAGFLAQQLSGSSDASVFAATDTNGDGAVSLDEFSADPAAKGVSSNNLQQLFSMIDSNGDGSISQGETTDFLDQVRSAISGQNGAPPPGGPAGPGGPPPAAANDDGTPTASTSLLSLAQNAYSTASKSTDLVSMLQSLLQTAA